MTKSVSLKLIAMGFVVASAASFFTFNSANAGVTSDLQNCNGGSRNQVVGCCQNAVRNALPQWMSESGQSCKQIVHCYKKRYCYIDFNNLAYEGKSARALTRGRGLK